MVFSGNMSDFWASSQCLDQKCDPSGEFVIEKML